MGQEFSPKLSVLHEPQRRLWDELADVPAAFVLYGGTAVALHLGHRQSIDFDLVSFADFDPDQVFEAMPLLRGSKVVQKSPNTLTCLVDRGGTVRVSFFGTPRIRPVRRALIAPGNHLNVATLLDLAGMKVAVVQKRAESRDYLDIDAMIHQGGIDLATALAAGRVIYGESFSPEISLKALSYFEDGDLQKLPKDVRDRLAAAVNAVPLDRLPDIDPEIDI